MDSLSFCAITLARTQHTHPHTHNAHTFTHLRTRKHTHKHARKEPSKRQGGGKSLDLWCHSTRKLGLWCHSTQELRQWCNVHHAARVYGAMHHAARASLPHRKLRGGGVGVTVVKGVLSSWCNSPLRICTRAHARTGVSETQFVSDAVHPYTPHIRHTPHTHTCRRWTGSSYETDM